MGRRPRAGPAKVVDDVELTVTKASGDDGFHVVTVLGEVDVSSAPQLEARLTELVTSGNPRVVVDLTGVGFLDSSGLGALINVRTAAVADGGALPLVCTSERVLKLFTITGLDAVFDIHTSVGAALAG